MRVAITAAANEARLLGLLAFLDLGPDTARLWVYGGDAPATPYGAPSSSMLVEIRLARPAGEVADGVLTLTQLEDGLITATGLATWARLVTASGVTVLDLDCSDAEGDGAVKLATTQLYLGGAARLAAATLA